MHISIFSYSNGGSKVPLIHSSPSVQSCRNKSISNNSSVGYDEDAEDLLKCTERESLLAKGEIRRVSSSSLRFGWE